MLDWKTTDQIAGVHGRCRTWNGQTKIARLENGRLENDGPQPQHPKRRHEFIVPASLLQTQVSPGDCEVRVHWLCVIFMILPRYATHKRDLFCHAVSVRLSVRVSAKVVYSIIFSNFSQSGKPTILVFHVKHAWHIHWSMHNLNLLYILSINFCRAMRDISAAYVIMRCACVCVRHVRGLCQNE